MFRATIESAVSIANRVAACLASQMRIKKARNAATPSPEQKLSIIEAP